MDCSSWKVIAFKESLAGLCRRVKDEAIHLQESESGMTARIVEGWTSA
jgi:hypothetical protein